MFIVSGRMSTKTSFAPARTNAVAVEEKVKLGRMTSSPGWRSQRSAAISSAVVPEVVRSAFWAQNLSSSHSWQRIVNGPSPEIL